MKCWRVLIVDDEPAARDWLVNLCTEVADLQVVAAAEDVAAAREALAAQRPDIVFLDVQMPGEDGFGLLDWSPAGDEPAVVFVTAHADYAVRAFESQATDYLLKPFDADRFREAVRRAIELLERRRDDRLAERLGDLLARGSRRELPPIVARAPGRISFVRPEEIEWLDAAGNSVKIYTRAGMHKVRETIHGIERLLDASRFARIHRSTIVNLDRVREVLISSHGDYTVVTDGGRRLTVGRQYRYRLQALTPRAGNGDKGATRDVPEVGESREEGRGQEGRREGRQAPAASRRSGRD